MKFFYNQSAGSDFIELCGDAFLHLKARRIKVGERIDVRNLRDNYNYIYEITQISRREANLSLVFKHSVVENSKANLRTNFNTNAQNITKNLSKEKLETKTIFKNDGKPLSLTETQAKQKLEKLEKNPFKKILTPSQEKQQNLINKRQEIIRNTAKVTTTHINKIQYNQKIDKNKDLNGKTIKNKDNDIEER